MQQRKKNKSDETKVGQASVFNSFFFSSGLADVALRLGPDRNISGKSSCTRTLLVRTHWQIMTKIVQTNKQQSQDDPQIPQPDLRFVTETAKQQQRGKAQTTTPTQRFASGHSDMLQTLQGDAKKEASSSTSSKRRQQHRDDDKFQ